MPRWLLTFEDHFNNSQIDPAWKTDVGGGSVSESSALTLALGAGAGGDWWTGSYNGPAIYHPGIGYGRGFYYVEARLTNYARTGGTYNTAGILFLGARASQPPGDKSRMYYAGWYPGNAWTYVQWVNDNYDAGDVWNSGSAKGDPNTTPHRYRVYWNSSPNYRVIDLDGRGLAPGYLAYYYSIDDGATWTFATTWAPFFTDFGGVGLCMRNWNGHQCSTTWDYFRYYVDLEPEPRLTGDGTGYGKDKGSLEDFMSLPNVTDYSGDSGQTITQEEAGGGLEDGHYLVDAGGSPFIKQRLRCYPDLRSGLYIAEKGSLEDGSVVSLGFDTTYWYLKTDSDGKYYLGDSDIMSVLYVDSTLVPWNTPTAGFYGIGRDGRWYYDGQQAQPGNFGTLAGGFNNRSWMIGGQEPLGNFKSSVTSLAMVADDKIRLSGVGIVNGEWCPLRSNCRWYLTGDFDIQVSFENYSASGGTDGGFALAVNGPCDGAQEVYIRRHLAGQYDTDVKLNNSWVNYASVGTSHTSGRLRIVRSGSSVSRYYWNGTSWTQLGSTYAWHAGTVHARVFIFGTGSFNVTVDAFAFTINSGAWTNYCGWAREAASATRGSKVDFPLHALVVATRTSLDIIDADTSRLWMRFTRAVDNILHAWSSATPSPVYMVMRDGVLFVSHRSPPEQADEGSALRIDFNLDWVRIHRNVGSTVTGGHNKSVSGNNMWPRDTTHGSMQMRNLSKSYWDDLDKWQLQTNRVNATEIYFASPWEYRFVATNNGVSGFRWKRWYLEGDTDSHFNTPSRGTSGSGEFHWIAVDPVTQDLLYTSLSTLYVAHESTWKAGVIYAGGSWVADHQWTIPGSSISPTYNRGGVIDSGYLYMNRNEGVYRVEIATGTSEHLYGTAASSATCKILPDDLKSVTAIIRTLDGATPVWVLAVERVMGTQLYLVNASTNEVMARGKFVSQRTIRSVAA